MSSSRDLIQHELPNTSLVGCVRIEERAIYPTDEQAQACLRVCQMLSTGFRDIQLFRFDPITGDGYILASDDIGIIVPPDGDWRFIS